MINTNVNRKPTEYKEFTIDVEEFCNFGTYNYYSYLPGSVFYPKKSKFVF